MTCGLRFAESTGIPLGLFRTVQQVHGTQVLEARLDAQGNSGVPLQVGTADALWTDAPRLALVVRTADCIPLLIEDGRTGNVAAVHSGWKGTLGEIAKFAVEAFKAHGSQVADLRCALGPSIQSCCYEVDEALARRFEGGFGSPTVIERNGRSYLDLARALGVTLKRQGLLPEQVDNLGMCTACDGARFFSHRRDRGATGRHWSYILKAG